MAHTGGVHRWHTNGSMHELGSGSGQEHVLTSRGVPGCSIEGPPTRVYLSGLSLKKLLASLGPSELTLKRLSASLLALRTDLKETLSLPMDLRTDLKEALSFPFDLRTVFKEALSLPGRREGHQCCA